MSKSSNPMLPRVDPRVLGRRLTDARKARDVTQEEAAKHLGCSRPTLIAIEKGERPAKPEEIVKLAGFYGRRLHELVRPGEQSVDLQPHLRAAVDRQRLGDGELIAAIAELQQFVEDYRELERLMNAPLRYNYPPPVELEDRLDPVDLAEAVAARERQRLGLGDQPVHNLRSVLEWDVGLRILYGSLPSMLAGLYAYADEVGCCIFINVKHPPVRRRASMVHEYGHLIIDRYKPGVDYLSVPGRKPANERFAETFAMAFLMPVTSVRHRFHETVTTTGDFQMADLVRLSHYYFVSVQAMALRLEGLGLIPRNSSDIFEESRFAVRRAQELLQLPSLRETGDPYPERYKFLAVHAFEQGKLSEGQLARFLRCDRTTAREIVDQCRTSDSDVGADGRRQSLQLELQHSLLMQAS
jgi:Zn-dependent peptidase ImmA (M78 family)/DNA-binding XRE family transcriptional regulator